MGFNMPILVMDFVITQVLRIATGSTTVALTTTAAIVSGAAATSGVSILVFACILSLFQGMLPGLLV